MKVKELYNRGKLSDVQMLRLVRLGKVGNSIGITQEEFETITGKKISDVITLDEAKTMWHEAINGIREQSQAEGVVEYDGDTFEVNEKSQANMNSIFSAASLVLANGGTQTFGYRSATNVTHEFTAKQIVELSLAMVAKVQSIYTTSWSLKTKVDECTTVDEVFAVELN